MTDREAFRQAQIEGQDNLAADIFERSGKAFSEPFLGALGVDPWAVRWEFYSPSWRAFAGGHVTARLVHPDTDEWAFVSEVCYQKGAIRELNLHFGRMPARVDLRRALELEPISKALFRFPSGSPASLWLPLSVPDAGRWSKLDLLVEADTDTDGFFEDPHLHSIAELDFFCNGESLNPGILPSRALSQLGESGWRPIRLDFSHLDTPGLEAVSRYDWAIEELKLSADGWGNEVPLTPLLQARYLEGLRSLFCLDCTWDPLLEDKDWPHLRQLMVNGGGLSDADLVRLARRPWLEQLELLDIGGNRLGPERTGLEALVARLDPARLRRLGLGGCHLGPAPAFLDRFAEGVVVVF